MTYELTQFPAVMEPEPWMAAGNCVGINPDLFYPERGESCAYALAVCASCVVKTECLNFAVFHREPGIWGGTTSADRRKIRHDNPPPVRLVVSREPRQPNCGTNSGYVLHRRRYTEPCAPCRQAHALYERSRKAGS